MHVPVSAATLAIRMWWPVIVALTLLGGAAGHQLAKDAPYTAVTTLRVNTAGFGEVAQQSIVETGRLLIDSNRVYRRVAGDDPVAIEELRQRTTVDIVASSSVIELAVSAQTAEQAEREIEALAQAAIANFGELAEEQFLSAIRSGRDGLVNGVLPDPVAEQARRDALGVAIAEQQDNALRLSQQLSRIGAVLPATVSGVGSRIAIIMGGLGGGVAGCVVALLIGVGRRRVRRLFDVRSVSPSLVACEPLDCAEGVAHVAATCSRLQYPLAVVLAMPGAGDAAMAVVDRLRAELLRDGARPFRLEQADLEHASAEGHQPRLPGAPSAMAIRDTNGSGHSGPRRPGARTEPLTAAVPALGMPNRAIDLAAADADVLLVTGTADEDTLQRIAARADVVLLVARPRVTRLGELATVCGLLRLSRPPVLVLADVAIPVHADQDHADPNPDSPTASGTLPYPVGAPVGRSRPYPEKRLAGPVSTLASAAAPPPAFSREPARSVAVINGRGPDRPSFADAPTVATAAVTAATPLSPAPVRNGTPGTMLPADDPHAEPSTVSLARCPSPMPRPSRPQPTAADRPTTTATEMPTIEPTGTPSEKPNDASEKSADEPAAKATVTQTGTPADGGTPVVATAPADG